MAGCIFLETCVFFLGCHIPIHSNCLGFFEFLLHLLLLSSLISYFDYLGHLSLLLLETGERFVNFVYPFQISALGFIVFFSCLLKKSLIYSSLIFITSFFLLIQVLFVLLFLTLLGCRLGCLFEISLFWRSPILLWTSLLDLLLVHSGDFVWLCFYFVLFLAVLYGMPLQWKCGVPTTVSPGKLHIWLCFH